MTHNVHKLAACSVALSALVIGCTPTSQSYRPTSLATISPTQEKDSTRLYAKAKAAVEAGKLGEALSLAEQSVALNPRDVGYRMLLGDLYLKNGRFNSAETSFADVVALDPGNVRGTLSLALSLIAQGKKEQASAELAELDGTAAAGDLGLAYALAGQHERARTLLESAARETNSTGRVRQNLALAYALSGDWKKARTVAAQDISPAELDARLAHWATLATPASSYTQVAALLGVTPVEDAGQPVRLALAAPEPSTTAFAQAAPVAAPVAVSQPEPVAVALAPVPPQQPAPVSADELPVQFAAAAEDLVAPSPAVIRASLPVDATPLRAFKPVRAPKFASRPLGSRSGRFVVQIGAFRNLNQASRAWGEALKRHDFSADTQPLSTTVTLPGRGTFYRLSIAPFDAPAQAARACQAIRANGGACFVRSVAGDAPLQYAMRASRRGKPSSSS
jgi:Flp pilus assembly protein TadD